MDVPNDFPESTQPAEPVDEAQRCVTCGCEKTQADGRQSHLAIRGEMQCLLCQWRGKGYAESLHQFAPVEVEDEGATTMLQARLEARGAMLETMDGIVTRERTRAEAAEGERDRMKPVFDAACAYVNGNRAWALSDPLANAVRALTAESVTPGAEG